MALTRSAKSPTAQQFSKLPAVDVVEFNWVDITADWLCQHHIVRAFIAPHNQPNQFAEESTFHLAALKAGLDYIVRISTTAANVRPNCDAYYPRSHWAIEALLSSPEFKGLKWTSLQPNVFATFWLWNAAELIKNYQKTGQQSTLRVMASRDAPVGVIHPDDVGDFAAHLLVTEDVSPHNGLKYNLNGPEDITGNQIVEMIEKYIGVPVKDVSFKDITFVDDMASNSGESKSVISTIKYALVTAWEGKCTASTTSPGVTKIAAPKRTPKDVMKALLEA
ncbi:hypothetical protein AYO21_08906 [Fonsecaea monophora]|uniref:Uncharacterized protein n=1 Tax=Fonsecaea monophora TaxID=254056 RepID=A0A177EY33_9EURO|nr:hypothetical protein AYO21_08906 [Fonsecaea monophora]OAG36945.1 hypothetical protein AYO21_08906 [Fonsecaea monophora]